MRGRRPPLRVAVGLAAICAALGIALLVGLGGGSDGGEATAYETPAHGSIVGSRDMVSETEGATEIESARFPNGQDTDEVSASGTKPIKPCKLVSAAEANRILGGDVTISEHSQGPTCVFAGSGREVSLVMMEARIKPLVEGARSSEALTIAGHRAWCLRYETTSVVAVAGKGRVLQVTGPCPAGARFAAAALPRIP